MTKHIPSVNIITLGCSKNSVDSEVIGAQLKKMGHTVLHDSTEDTDIVIINTCSFIRDAKEQSIDEILLHAERKKAGIVKKIYVVGCLAQRYKEDLQQMIPEVDAFYTFSELHKLFKLDQFDLLAQSDRLLSTPSHYAYLKISEGCDRNCSYCAIPLIRGKQVSKPIDILVEEARKLAQTGVKELMLIAQDLTYYGMDLSGHRDLEMLLRRLAIGCANAVSVVVSATPGITCIFVFSSSSRCSLSCANTFISKPNAPSVYCASTTSGICSSAAITWLYIEAFSILIPMYTQS